MAKKITQVKPAVVPVSSLTIIEFLLDETGSMGSVREPTIAGFNQFLREQRGQSGRCLLTLTKFDTAGQRTPYVDMDIQMVPELTRDTYTPNASTNLFDTIGRRIMALDDRVRGEEWTTKPNVLFVIMTDGEDNSSREHNASTIKTMIGAYENQGWTFVYLGANQDAWAYGRNFGIRQANTKSYDTAHMAETMATLSAATTSYRAYAATGSVGSDYEFFDPKAAANTKEGQ